jgi:hypothetical protein
MLFNETILIYSQNNSKLLNTLQSKINYWTLNQAVYINPLRPLGYYVYQLL